MAMAVTMASSTVFPVAGTSFFTVDPLGSLLPTSHKHHISLTPLSSSSSSPILPFQLQHPKKDLFFISTIIF